MMPHPSIKTTRAFSPWRRTVDYKQCVRGRHVSKHVHFWTPTIGETFEPENPTKACVRCCSDDKFHRGQSRTEEYLRITLNIFVPKRKTVHVDNANTGLYICGVQFGGLFSKTLHRTNLISAIIYGYTGGMRPDRPSFTRLWLARID